MKRFLRASVVALVLWSSPAYAQVVLHTLDHALVVAFANEWALVQKGTAEPGQPTTPTWNDPVKVRVGSFAPTGYYGAISGDRLFGDKDRPSRHEKTLIAFKEDNEFSGEARRPMIQFQVQRTVDTYKDADMRKALSLTGDYALFHVPVYAPNLSGGGGPAPTASDRLISPQGRFVTAMQEDGNLVIYDTATQPWTALWWTGTGTQEDRRAWWRLWIW